jgi:tRNA G18 (ribose-2'-O)-methylase SpoU
MTDERGGTLVPVVHIDTVEDPRLDPYRSLTAHDAKRRDERFVAESREVVRALLESRRFAVRSVLLTEPARIVLTEHLARRAEVPVYVAPLPVLKRVVGFDFHRGCVALGERGVERSAADLLAAGPRRLVVLEGASNPDNVGGVLRSARALGADAVLLSPDCCDPLYRKTVRVSMGAALALPWAQAHAWEGEWLPTLARLRASGFTLIALTPRGGIDVASVGDALSVSARVALLVGAEGDGLRPATLAGADLQVRVPMVAGVDSLNLVTACTVALDRFGWARNR